ncbi:toxin-antitoxin system YwqK family antitoxin [Hymenobacter siberiensis]|uniref:toxin-antitoxin system YwqK family antitoxin n=1 Tax=Hymenobacter siberiensis TaxID=2848396 RepID=UPI001C1E0206|nr:hypothetical protein [Hymenobacter siberiensis]
MKYFRSFLLLASFVGLALHGQAQKATAAKALIKRTYYDYQGRQLHEEYQYVSTPTNRFSKQGYYKEYNEDGTLWRKHSYRNNKADGRQLEYSTSEGETWLEYDIMVRNNLRNGPYIRYSGPNEQMSAGNYVNGSREGQWKFYYPEGHEVCTYRNDKKEGPATLFYKSGKVADQYAYREDEKYNDGDVKAFYEDGSPKKSGHFTDGQMDGKFLAWYPNGQLRYEENYVADSREGRILAFDQHGDTLANDRYVNDIMVAHRKSAQELALQAEKDQRAKREKASETLAKARNVLDDVLFLEDRRREKSGTSAALSSARSPYATIYDTLVLACQKAGLASDNPDKELAIAQRLLAAMQLAQEMYSGKNPGLQEKIGTETDPAKIFALMGI